VKHYIYGAGGHGKVVLDAMQLAGLVCDGFVDDKPINQWVGLPVFPPAILTQDTDISIHFAIGHCGIRQQLSEGLIGVQCLSVKHPSAVVSLSADIVIGSFLAAGSIVGPDAKVGRHCIINHQAVVDHDCVVGDFCHIAPHASLGGGVKIGRGVLIGAGAVILPGLSIGDYAVVGAGAVVTKSVESGLTVVGNPALVIS
jgi:sugar O-acyltransferase (sialic acid O-acetyltransferase NeuD family)